MRKTREEGINGTAGLSCTSGTSGEPDISGIEELIKFWTQKEQEMNRMIEAGEAKGISAIDRMKPLQMLYNLNWMLQVHEHRGTKKEKG